MVTQGKLVAIDNDIKATTTHEEELLVHCLEITETIKQRFCKIRGLCLIALHTDGGHHKQFYLEQIFKTIGAEIEEGAPKWVPGVPP